ncbi:MAG: long-chain fatty acid transporter [Candidatus Mcinerneyibacterium aminivorans]|uniref:Long-chain fatty acid transporter n=1 Tax=Candidatus Mcinerneyibacterium aminivorans TaxID=2703815 RepID=A0A5D0MEL8_9BACT|nr:MAG: long-chain fatty acid transporter [Candidatus Mcinerneyibacterium aminivorans]
MLGKKKLFLVLGTIFLIVSITQATNGYFTHGYTTKGKGLAGAEVALPIDSFSGVSNPALITDLSSNYSFGLGVFMPFRYYKVTGNPSGAPGTFPLIPQKVESEKNYFIMPKVGTKFSVKKLFDMSINIYGNGGMNTHYDTAVFNGEKPTGVDLSQLFTDITFAKKVSKNHSFGVSAVLAYQRFKAEGLQAFTAFSASSEDLTNNDYDNSFGYGAKIGYYGKFNKYFNLGLSYQTRIMMSELDKYKGLFAEQGDFDIPSQLNLGVASSLTDKITLNITYQRIFYSNINPIANEFNPLDFGSGILLGDDNGPGFGWEDMNIYKTGVDIKLNKDYSLQAGYSYGKSPIDEKDVMLNILAPAVIENHLTIGVTKKIKNNNLLSLSIMHGLSNKIKGYNPMEAPEQQEIELEMHQWEVELGYSF